jgi:GNAT superfamily N-acetyltransferase
MTRFDEGKHPRWPGGAPDSHGGEFRGEDVPGGDWVSRLSETVDGLSGRPSDLHDLGVIQRVFRFNDTSRSGLRVTGVTRSPSGSSTYVNGEIHDKHGPVGEVSWTIREPRQSTAYLGGIGIEPEAQGGGFGARYLAHVEAELRKLGIKKIELYADIDVGGYAWAKMGFDFRGNNEEATIQVAMMVWLADHRPVSKELEDRMMWMSHNSGNTPLEYAMLGWEPGMSTWPGKEIMLGTSWNAVKRL